MAAGLFQRASGFKEEGAAACKGWGCSWNGIFRVMLLEMFCREGGGLLGENASIVWPTNARRRQASSSFFHQLDVEGAGRERGSEVNKRRKGEVEY